MAKVKISTLFDASTAAGKQESYKLFLASAEDSKHHIVEDPDEADLILFTDTGENQYSAPTDHACFRAFPQKCFIFSDADNPFPILPGVYASIPKRVYDPFWTRSGYYLRKGLLGFEPLSFDRGTNLLFSFIGSCENAPIRERLKLLPSSRSIILDIFRANNRANSEGNLEALKVMLRQYISLCRRSRFVLCPRGVGVSTMRLFESMAMARSPVILSDEWVPLPNVPWEQFSIRVSESDWAKIPEILKGHERNAEQFGLRARKVWESHFSLPKVLDTTIELCLDIFRGGKTKKPLAHTLKLLSSLRRPHIRPFIKSMIHLT
jgi:hypothetical protein